MVFNLLFPIFRQIIIAFKIFVSNIPTVIGMATNPAELRVDDAGFDCAVANGYSDEEEYGFIYEQNKYNED